MILHLKGKQTLARADRKTGSPNTGKSNSFPGAKFKTLFNSRTLQDYQDKRNIVQFKEIFEKNSNVFSHTAMNGKQQIFRKNHVKQFWPGGGDFSSSKWYVMLLVHMGRTLHYALLSLLRLFLRFVFFCLRRIHIFSGTFFSEQRTFHTSVGIMLGVILSEQFSIILDPVLFDWHVFVTYKVGGNAKQEECKKPFYFFGARFVSEICQKVPLIFDESSFLIKCATKLETYAMYFPTVWRGYQIGGKVLGR